MSRHPIPLEDRFWAKVRRSEGCWWWTASCDRDGYGHIGAGDGTKRLLIAHRLSWELHFGLIPDGAQVLHTCDQPRCVRPDHLFLGDPASNAADKVAKGRHRCGYDTVDNFRPNQKLTEAKVREIRTRAAAGESQHAIAAWFGISQANVSFIVRRQTWSHIP